MVGKRKPPWQIIFASSFEEIDGLPTKEKCAPNFIALCQC